MDVFAFLGGVGLFLYGLRVLSDSLTELAGTAGEKLTKSGAGPQGKKVPFGVRLRYALLGVGITAVLQSSGAVTVFAVGAADAGLLPVSCAVALCWGANLGTTATGQLLRLSAEDAFGPLLRQLCCFAGGLGALVLRGRAKSAGTALAGLGLTFTGLAAVQDALLPFTQSAAFPTLLLRLENPAAALATGALMAAAMQSSSGAIGLLQAAAAGGMVPWRVAVPLVLGINLGTCTTALAVALAAQNKKAAAIRVAAGHVFFNAAGCAAVGVAAAFCRGAAFWHSGADFAGVADWHTLFNGGTLVLLLALSALRELLFARQGRTQRVRRPYSQNSFVER